MRCALGVVIAGWLASFLSTSLALSVAGALATVFVVGALELLGAVPVVGDVVALAVLASGVGAVVVTYLGLAPLRLPAPARA